MSSPAMKRVSPCGRLSSPSRITATKRVLARSISDLKSARGVFRSGVSGFAVNPATRTRPPRSSTDSNRPGCRRTSTTSPAASSLWLTIRSTPSFSKSSPPERIKAGLATRATLYWTPAAWAYWQERMLTSSMSVTAISRSAFPSSAFCRMSGEDPDPWMVRTSNCASSAARGSAARSMTTTS